MSFSLHDHGDVRDVQGWLHRFTYFEKHMYICMSYKVKKHRMYTLKILLKVIVHLLCIIA